MLNQAANALGSNAVTNALGIDFGTMLTPSKFLTKFTPSTVFAYRSLAYEIQSSKNFDVIFHWFPRSSQIRSMFANAFSAADTNEINLLVRNIQMPQLTGGQSVGGNDRSRRFQATFPGSAIIKLDRNRRGYEVKLNNGLEVEYDPTFQIIDIDD